MNDYPTDLRSKIINDLIVMSQYKRTHKDICVVVHDQFDCVKACLESVMEHTQDYTLWVWDNCSSEPTGSYLKKLEDDGKIELRWMHKNWGFIEPMNKLFVEGGYQYVILLNSDTVVADGWDRAMLAHLQTHENTGLVGYQGGLLDENGVGGRLGVGYNIDYVAGWCMAVRRSDISPPRLFDSKNLVFAYGEDADLSLRMKEKGFASYALHLDLVAHQGNKTTLEIAKDPGMAIKMKKTFDDNHAYIRRRWANYLTRGRIDLQSQASEPIIQVG